MADCICHFQPLQHLCGCEVELEPWPELISYFLQMDLSEAEMSHCIILILIFNYNLVSPLNSTVLHASLHAFIHWYYHLNDIFNNKCRINKSCRYIYGILCIHVLSLKVNTSLI